MIQKRKLYIALILIILSIIAAFPNQAMARLDATTAIQDGGGGSIGKGGGSTSTGAARDPITNPDDYKPGAMNTNDANIIASKAGLIFDTITTVGIIAAVLTLIIIGIKYMIGSVEEKAEYKKTMIPYIIGVVMLLGISGILRIIASVVENIG